MLPYSRKTWITSRQGASLGIFQQRVQHNLMVSAGEDGVISSEEVRTFKTKNVICHSQTRPPTRVKSHFAKHPVCGGSFGLRYQSNDVFLQQEIY